MISLDYDHITALSKLISKWSSLNPNAHTNALAKVFDVFNALKYQGASSFPEK